MINVKKLLTKILTSLANKVDRTGDTMSGDLVVEKEGGTSRIKAITLEDGTQVAGGQFASNSVGNFGIYDTTHNKWMIRSDIDGTTHVPATLTTLMATKITTTVGTTYKYTAIPPLSNWNVIAIRFVVHENSQILFFVRGEVAERSLTDWPAAGKFRGGIWVDWKNNRIGFRCLNAGSQNNYTHLVYFDYVYGVL